MFKVCFNSRLQAEDVQSGLMSHTRGTTGGGIVVEDDRGPIESERVYLVRGCQPGYSGYQEYEMPRS